MERNIQEALTEVYEILKVTAIELTSRIPTKFRKMVEDNRAKDYRFILEEPFDERDLKQETIVILGLIYRDFFADPEEREELQLKDKEEIKRIEEEMNKQYDMNTIFQQKNAKNKKNEVEETDLILYKEQSFFKKILNLIRGVFKRA